MKMILTSLAIAMTFSFFSFADHHEGGDMMKEMKGKKFEEAKKMMMEHVEKRMTHLSDLKTCISGAADKPALKDCRMKHKETMKGHREMRKEMRAKRKEAKKAMKEMSK
ncbi:MAG: hypothetical protein AAF203_10810 [Pseudomonadota bacterium]